MTHMFCDRCGHLNRAGARFCARCGNELGDEPEAGDAPQTPDEPRHAAPTAAALGARRRGLRGTPLAVLIAVLLLGILYGAYNAMAASTYSNAVDAHKRFDCSKAADKYGQLVGFYSLAITAHRSTARERQAECRAVLEAEAAAQHSEHQNAAKLYEQILEVHASSSPIADKLRERRAEELLFWGDSAKRRAADDPELFTNALSRYDTVLTELGQTSQAEAAKERITRGL
jgi:hypothetical protein